MIDGDDCESGKVNPWMRNKESLVSFSLVAGFVDWL